MAQQSTGNDRPVWKMLVRRGSHFMEADSPPLDEQASFLSYLKNIRGFQGFWEVIKAWPGSGKSRDASDFVNRAWQVGGYKGLYLMLSHPAIEERLVKLREFGQDKDWAHWRPHAETCARKRMNAQGYFGQGQCTCGRGPLKAEGPTLAPMDYILPSSPISDVPLVDAVNDFDFWIIDEMDFRRLLGLECASLEDVQTTAATHPDETVRGLCGAIEELMWSQGQGRLNGSDLYESIGAIFARTGATFPPKEPGSLQLKPWLSEGDGKLPRNFSPVLVPVLLSEARDWARGDAFTPRVHLVRKGQHRELKVWWRKELEVADWGTPARPFFILDATADENLLSNIFLSPDVQELEAPTWPENVHVHQWSDDLVSRTTLGLPFNASPYSPRSLAARQRWYRRIAEALYPFSRDWPVGIITHQPIEDEARKAIQDMGFAKVDSLHYGDERGRNTLEDVRLLVLLGLPIPNPDTFKEEAQAFLYDSNRPLDFTWEAREQQFEMRDGSRDSRTVQGYWKEPVASYYRQKCQFGLYQAVHRLRPHLIEADDERHIFIFTNMPVQGVIVKDFLRDSEIVRIEGRFDNAVQQIEERLEESGKCTVPELSRLLAATDERPPATIRRWISQNAESLAEAAGLNFIRGATGRPGRFESQG